MKLIVCAKSENGRFIGLPSATGYAVFSSAQADAIQPGDILANPTWDDESGLQPTVRNLTTEEDIKVRLESWALELAQARALLAEEEQSSGIVWHPPWPGT